MRKISAKIGVTALFALALFALSISQASAQKFKDKAEGPVTLEVDCDAGESIQAAVDSAVDGDTINVSGTCNEAITIDKNRIQLIGGPEAGPQGASIIGPAETPAISVRGLNVRIVGFSAITGGDGGITPRDDPRTRQEVGIWVRRGASAIILNNTVKDSRWHGIRVRQGSSARIENTTVTNNGSNGIRVVDSSAADILGCTITFNQSDGIRVGRESAAVIDNTTSSDNGSDGIDVQENGGIRLSPTIFTNQTNTFERNRRFGIRCKTSSTIQVQADQTFGIIPDQNNSGDTSIASGCELDVSGGVTFP